MQTLCIHQFILESLRDGYMRDSINRMNNGRAKPLIRIQKVKTYQGY